MEDYPLDIFWIFTPHRTSYDSTIEGPLRVAGTCRPRATVPLLLSRNSFDAE